MSHYGHISDGGHPSLNGGGGGGAKWPPPLDAVHHAGGGPALVGYKTAFSAFHQTNGGDGGGGGGGLLPGGGYRQQPQAPGNAVNGNGYPSHYNPHNLPQQHSQQQQQQLQQHLHRQQGSPATGYHQTAWQGVRLPTISPLSSPHGGVALGGRQPQHLLQSSQASTAAQIHLTLPRNPNQQQQQHSPSSTTTQQHRQQQQQQQHLSYLLSPTSNGSAPHPFQSQVSPHYHQYAAHQQPQHQQQWSLHSPPTSAQLAAAVAANAVSYHKQLPQQQQQQPPHQQIMSSSPHNSPPLPPRPSATAAADAALLLHHQRSANGNGHLRTSQGNGAGSALTAASLSFLSGQSAVYGGGDHMPAVSAAERWRQQQQQQQDHQHLQPTPPVSSSGVGSKTNEPSERDGHLILTTTPNLSISTTDSGLSPGTSAEAASTTVTPPSPKYQQISPVPTREGGPSADERAHSDDAGNAGGDQQESSMVVSSSSQGSTPILNVVDNHSPSSAVSAQIDSSTQELEPQPPGLPQPDDEAEMDGGDLSKPTSGTFQGSQTANDDDNDGDGRSDQSDGEGDIDQTSSHRLHIVEGGVTTDVTNIDATDSPPLLADAPASPDDDAVTTVVASVATGDGGDSELPQEAKTKTPEEGEMASPSFPKTDQQRAEEASGKMAPPASVATTSVIDLAGEQQTSKDDLHERSLASGSHQPKMSVKSEDDDTAGKDIKQAPTAAADDSRGAGVATPGGGGSTQAPSQFVSSPMLMSPLSFPTQISMVSQMLPNTAHQTMAQICDPNYATSLRIQEKVRNEALGITAPPTHAPSSTLPPLTRPPGLGPPPASAYMANPMGPSGTLMQRNGGAGGPTVYTCPMCGFSSASKFHFNSHMNTHTDHQCTMCDYTSRTEGRLKRHMKEFHTDEQRANVGVLDSMDMSSRSSLDDSSSTPVTMINVSGGQQFVSPSTEDEARLDLGGPSALEQIQALTAQTQRDVVGISTSLLNDLTRERDSRSGGSGGGSGGAGGGGTGGGGGSGKPKNYKCKQCGHTSVSKDESWAHARQHIPSDKQLSCPQCQFVTEYKHHLEYHLRNHFGQKPFQCKKCNYSCVNKSMLNSHMKSHSNVYQYRCMNCTYATKYCHSLKLHLRKYGHTPASVIQPDGTRIDPTAHLDLQGNRRLSVGGGAGGAGPHRPTRPRSSSPPTRGGALLHGGPEHHNHQFLSPPPSSHHQQQQHMHNMGGAQPGAHAAGQGGGLGGASFAAAQMLMAQQQQQQQQQRHMEAAAIMNRIATFGVQLPAIPAVTSAAGSLSLPVSAASILNDRPPMDSGNNAFRCKLCGFQAPSGDELIKHNLQHVLDQQPDLSSFYGLVGAGSGSGVHRPSFREGVSHLLPSSHHQQQQQMLMQRQRSMDDLQHQARLQASRRDSRENEEDDQGTAGGRPHEETTVTTTSDDGGHRADGATGPGSGAPHSLEQSPNTADGSHISTGSPISGKGSSDESGSGEQQVAAGGSSRRKGKAFRLDQIAMRLQTGKPGSPTHSGGSSSAANDDLDHTQTEGDSPPAKMQKRMALEAEDTVGRHPLLGASSYLTNDSANNERRRSNTFSGGSLASGVAFLNRQQPQPPPLTSPTTSSSYAMALSAAIQQSEQNRRNAIAAAVQQHHQNQQQHQQNQQQMMSMSSSTPTKPIAVRIAPPPPMGLLTSPTRADAPMGARDAPTTPRDTTSQMGGDTPSGAARDTPGMQRDLVAVTCSSSSSTPAGGPQLTPSGTTDAQQPPLTPSTPHPMPHMCTHCRIGFEDGVMHQIHMGYHGYGDPFKCNRCGHVTADRLSFNMHLFQGRHD